MSHYICILYLKFILNLTVESPELKINIPRYFNKSSFSAIFRLFTFSVKLSLSAFQSLEQSIGEI